MEVGFCEKFWHIWGVGLGFRRVVCALERNGAGSTYFCTEFTQCQRQLGGPRVLERAAPGAYR